MIYLQLELGACNVIVVCNVVVHGGICLLDFWEIMIKSGQVKSFTHDTSWYVDFYSYISKNCFLPGPAELFSL